MTDQPSRRVLQATDRNVVHLWFDTDRTRGMRKEERQQFAHQIGRLLTDKGTAAIDWEVGD